MSEVEAKKKNNIIKKIFKLPLVLKLVILAIIILLIVGASVTVKMKHRETVLGFDFHNVGELVTQEWYGRILQDSSKDQKLFNKYSIPFTKSRIIFSLDVEVIAGVDFKDIDYKLSKDYSTVTIKIPKAKVYKYYQVPNTFISYLDDESWFTNISSKERHDLEDAVVEEGKKTAIKSGLLEKADENAKNIIEQMIRAKNKTIEIKWEEK